MITGTQVRMARAGLKLRMRDLAARAGVSPNTITRIEADHGGNASTLAAVRRALEEAGAVFVENDPRGVVVVIARPAGPDANPDAGLVRPEDLNSSNDG